MCATMLIYNYTGSLNCLSQLRAFDLLTQCQRGQTPRGSAQSRAPVRISAS